MDLETVIQSKSEREKQMLHINTYIQNLEKWYRSYLQSRNRDTDIQNKHVHEGGKRWSGKNQETGIDIYTVLILWIKYISDEKTPNRTGNSTQCSVVT